MLPFPWVFAPVAGLVSLFHPLASTHAWENGEEQCENITHKEIEELYVHPSGTAKQDKVASFPLVWENIWDKQLMKKKSLFWLMGLEFPVYGYLVLLLWAYDNKIIKYTNLLQVSIRLIPVYLLGIFVVKFLRTQTREC